jgi:tetratricopeptide (TPR) repeat protein
VRGALSIWGEVAPDHSDYATANQRMEEVRSELDRLVDRHKQRGRYYEQHGRLAESVLDYRLALTLEPGDDATLERVQQLVRLLAKRRAELSRAYRETFARGNLLAARDALAGLEIVDAFEPSLPSRRRELSQALRAAIARRMASGRNHFTSGRSQDARVEFEAALELDPQNESALGCLSHLDGARRPRPDDRSSVDVSDMPAAGCATDNEILAEDLYQKALAAERTGEFEAALRHDQRALSANDEHANARAHIDLLRLRMSDEVDSLLDEGVRAYREENLQLAHDFWQRALLIEPDNERASDYLDRVERQLRNLEQRRSAPDEAVE